MSRSTEPARQIERLHATVTELEDALRRMEQERDQLMRRRRRNLLIFGVALSVLTHLGLMLYLNLLHRRLPAGPSHQPMLVEFAVLQEPELTRDELQFEDLMPEVPLDDPEPAESPDLDLAPDVAAASLDISAAGSVPALGGSGGADGSTLGGGGGGTTFFGVSSQGSRFAYIVDVSGSMDQTQSTGQERKIDVAKRELARSIEMLPDYTHFYVLFFSSQVFAPPGQRGWTRARPRTVSRMIRSLDEIGAGGGTQPGPAFAEAFRLTPRPDVIFFLTDGQIPSNTVDAVAGLNNRGRRVVVNTIAFGDPASQELLREIARSSGGVYRFVRSLGW